MATTSPAQLTTKVVHLIDAVQAAVATYGLTRGEVNSLVRAAFTGSPVEDIDDIINETKYLTRGNRLMRRTRAQKIMRAALSADRDTLDALLWGHDVPQAVA